MYQIINPITLIGGTSRKDLSRKNIKYFENNSSKPDESSLQNSKLRQKYNKEFNSSDGISNFNF